jgi:predicted RNase H-like HicB family nuclease
MKLDQAQADGFGVSGSNSGTNRIGSRGPMRPVQASADAGSAPAAARIASTTVARIRVLSVGMRATIVPREAMPELRQNITATIRRGDESGFIGECLEVAVVTQGATVDETIENLRGAVALHLDGEDPADFGLRDCPTLLVTIEVQPSNAKAS